MAAGPAKRGILIIDDHPIVRHGLKELIAREPDLEVCGEASGAAEALRALETGRPDLAIVDISLGDGIALIRQVKARSAATKILVFSSYDERGLAARLLRAGASAYVCKREPLDNLLGALRGLLRGERHLGHHLGGRAAPGGASGEPSLQDPLGALSNRELQVFELVGRGLKSDQIAQKLGVTRKTVASHRENIKAKLSLASGAQLSRLAFQWVRDQS